MAVRYSFDCATNLSDEDLRDTMHYYSDSEGDSVGTGSFDFYHRMYVALKTEFYARHERKTRQ